MNNCPNCGSNVKQGEAFCRMCGTKIPVPQTNIYANTQQPLPVNNQGTNYQQPIANPSSQGFQQPQANGYINNGMPQNNYINNGSMSQNNYINNGSMSQNNYINNDDLIDSYIGKNSNSLKNGSFSANTFFFGFLYVLYRKMWLLGFIWFAISMVANMFLTSISGVITLAANIIISIKFKKLYLKHVEEQVEKIKAENLGKTKEQLMMICSQKGGTTLIPVIVTLILYGIIFFIAFATVLDTINKARENSQNTQHDYNNSSTNITNGTGTIGNLNVTIPSNLVEGSYSSDTYKLYRTDYSNSDSCSLKLSTSKVTYYNNDVKRYLEEDIYYSATDTYSGITQKAINDNLWYYATVASTYRQEYYYSIINNGTIYVVEFDITDDTNKTCSSSYNTVIDSLKFN